MMKISAMQQSLMMERMTSKKSIPNKGQQSFQKDYYIQSSDLEAVYPQYTKAMEPPVPYKKQMLAVSKEQFEALLKGEYGEVQTDGKCYWIVIDEVRYEFRKPSEEEEKPKSTYDTLLDTVEECLERNQEQLDKTFHEWTMKKDILYPNIGKNSIITLEEILEEKEKQEQLQG